MNKEELEKLEAEYTQKLKVVKALKEIKDVINKLETIFKKGQENKESEDLICELNIQDSWNNFVYILGDCIDDLGKL